MKLEFKDITLDKINLGSCFFLYGNYKKAFGAFCDFVVESAKNKFEYSSENIKVYYCSVAECSQLSEYQCSLFGENINFFCIKNVEDRHLEELSKLINSNSIFILESGDYGKSKKITDALTKSSNVYAVASFKNDGTLTSLCKLLLPGTSPVIHREIVKIMNGTDEDMRSLIKKMSLLIDGAGESLLNKYVMHRQSFLSDMDFIPLLRFILKIAIKERLGGKKQEFIKLKLSENMVESLLEAETKQKTGSNLSKSYIHHEYLFGT